MGWPEARSLTEEAPSLAGEAPSLNGQAPSLAGEAPSLAGEARSLTGEAPSLAGIIQFVVGVVESSSVRMNSRRGGRILAGEIDFSPEKRDSSPERLISHRRTSPAAFLTA